MTNKIIISCILLVLVVIAVVLIPILMEPSAPAASLPEETTANSTDESSTDETEPPVTIATENPNISNADEVYLENVDRTQIFPKVSSNDIRSLYISNQNGDYKLVLRNGELVIDGYYDPKNGQLLNLDREKLIQMIINAGFTLSTYRNNVTAADFEKYGLGENQHQAYFELTTKANDIYAVYIGNRTLDGKGYYARYPGRNTVYVLDNTIKRDLLGTKEYLASNMIVFLPDINAYLLVAKFTIYKNGEQFVSVDYLDAKDRNEFATMSVHRISYPENYTEYYVDDSYTSILRILSQLSADEIVSIDTDAETLAKYGIDIEKTAYIIEYPTTALGEEGTPIGVYPNTLYISEKQKDEAGNWFYYVYSKSFCVIAKVEATKLNFLEWELDKFVSTNIFSANIMNMASISYKAKDLDVLFELDGIDNKSLEVREARSGKKVDVSLFRKLWTLMLMTSHNGNSGLTDEQIANVVSNEENLVLEMAVTSRQGNSRVYRFYEYDSANTRNLLVTINGQGRFFTTRTMIDKTIADVGRVLRGEPVDPNARY